MKKYCLDMTVRAVEFMGGGRYVLLRLVNEEAHAELPTGRLPEMAPGQFVEVRVDGSPSTFLRRPVSICLVDRLSNELWLLVAVVGNGTRRLAQLREGNRLNCLLPLGHGFTLPTSQEERCLIVGGGVGVAPLLFLGQTICELGGTPTFLLGARSGKDLLLLSEFEKYGRVCVTTEDGTRGDRGFVTDHSVLREGRFDRILCCGPTPMMKAVAAYAREVDTACEVSLENMMACGLGACLCCVEKTVEGNLCVCTEGPVFSTNRLLWD